MLQGEMPTTIKGAMEICLGWEGSMPDNPSSMGNCVTALGQFESAHAAWDWACLSVKESRHDVMQVGDQGPDHAV